MYVIVGWGSWRGWTEKSDVDGLDDLAGLREVEKEWEGLQRQTDGERDA